MNPNASLKALDAFITAAQALRDSWSHHLEVGYPAFLPSFDEFVADLEDWRFEATFKTVIDDTTPNWPFILRAVKLGYTVTLYGTHQTGSYVTYRAGYYIS